MLIGKSHKIESDSLNVTVLEKKKTKAGKIYWKAIAYFSAPKEALKFLVDLKVKETGLVDLKTVVKKQDELYELIGQLKV